MAAKNHATILPDCNKESLLNQLAGAAFGAAGQRCMALSTAVFVGEANKWLLNYYNTSTHLCITSAYLFIYSNQSHDDYYYYLH